MSGKQSNRKPASSSMNTRKRAATGHDDHNDTKDFQQATLNTLRQIQQDIVNSKDETRESQKQLAEQILQRVEQLENANALRALATENEANRTLIKQLQEQLETANRRQEEQDQVMDKMRKKMVKLREKCADPIEFVVCTANRAPLNPLRMRPNDVIYVMKLKMRELLEVPLDRQHLVFEDQKLQDDKTLADYGIETGSMVHFIQLLTIREGGSNTINITIKTLYGSAIPLTVYSDDYSYVLMLRIREREGFPVHKQRLVFEGRQLEEGMTLAEYGIVDGSFVNFVVRIP
ncbi:hypothetical protein CAEBREN_19376 [Caenorhabditis brenneri]|uniref:Ubiquitin-like domain-containing protein n=1 Tax=Caenorhabditis brenneri TaxID=135651 RepID=G0MMV8_CAEBE|nr:hypothetical protein CAEBREN_19376 [Caenorhabditis brenneri]